MLVMQILNTGKDGINRIYNVKIALKGASKVKKSTSLRGFGESDIIVNGSSFNNSIFNTKNHDESVVVNYIRGKMYNSSKKDFLVTTRSNSDSKLYDLYNVSIPAKKVTSGLDRLYGKAIIDMQKEIPNINKGRYVSLLDLGICDHISDEKIDMLKYFVDKARNEDELNYLLLTNNLGNIKATIDFIKQFDFTIISEATIKEDDFNKVLSSLNYTSSRDARNLKRYYNIAKDNKDCYESLSKINRILYGKSINLIQKREKSKVLVKGTENKLRDSERNAA